uniref:Pleckstrin homology domain containing B1 n=1 Tax=Leptobrachium leishanense TaxID=445787 RepID=A0A8C5MDV1_9ANUR
MAFVKSGWLWRQSSILKRWKKHWFDLWMDGSLIYYPDENRGNLEERILLKFHCLSIKSGADCGDVQPPEGSPQDAMLLIHLRDHTRIYLCAESQDDAVAWKMALEDAKYFPVSDLSASMHLFLAGLNFYSPKAAGAMEMGSLTPSLPRSGQLGSSKAPSGAQYRVILI